MHVSKILLTGHICLSLLTDCMATCGRHIRLGIALPQRSYKIRTLISKGGMAFLLPLGCSMPSPC